MTNFDDFEAERANEPDEARIGIDREFERNINDGVLIRFAVHIRFRRECRVRMRGRTTWKRDESDVIEVEVASAVGNESGKGV